MTGKGKCQEALCRKKNPVCSKMLQTGFLGEKLLCTEVLRTREV